MLSKVLIANRGEIAARIIRTLDRMGIASVAVYHAVDRHLPAVKSAGEAFELCGHPPVSAYLDGDQIIEIALRAGAEAIHPGFGFLSENAEFASKVGEAGLVFIGPRPETIALMGNKIAARRFCLDHGFPLAPSVTDEGDSAAFVSGAEAIGCPLLIKAASGGGGKGMQIVERADELESAIALARAEAERSFGDSAVYAERLVECPRHIEVQLLGDGTGEVVHLGERDCSIQRRFQKVVEEAPAPGLDPMLRTRICETAVRIAATAKYLGAGTVEFIVSPDGEFYFLEMNTRLQVEHPVTEEVTGIDLVEQQLQIASGNGLQLRQSDIAISGHAIEVRLYAEDPEQEFSPVTGRLELFELPGRLARIETGVGAGDSITPAFDPMLAKVIVAGRDRDEALAGMRAALASSAVLGLTTNLDFLERIVAHPAFAAGDVHTGFIAQWHDALLPEPLSSGVRDAVLIAASALVPVDARLRPTELHAELGAWQNR